MTAQIIDGRKIAEEILAALEVRVAKLREKTIIPRLAVFLVGNNPASESYIRVKQKRAAEVGIEVEIKKYPESITGEELIGEINLANQRADVSGILVQLPLPPQLDKQRVFGAIDPKLVVEAHSPAAAAVRHILAILPIDLRTKKILIIGSGDLVGKPLANIFEKENLEFTVATRQTENLAEVAKAADVIITGTGQPGLVRGDMVKEGAVIIDAGTTGSEDGSMVGDVDFEGVSKKAGYLSPVPGGVGPVTVAMLLRAVVDNTESKL